MVAVLVISPRGLRLAEKLQAADPVFNIYAHENLNESRFPAFGRVPEVVCSLFDKTSGFVFLMASGIAVRSLAALLRDKTGDPGAVVVDEAGDYAVSLVGGHEGGANRLAYKVAGILDAVPIVTTGSETAKDAAVGIGCRRGIGRQSLVEAVLRALDRARIDPGRVRTLATVDRKKDEKGLIEAAAWLNLPLYFVSKRAIDTEGKWLNRSPAAKRALGVEAVCEPAALLAGRRMKLILPKQVFSGVTVAVAQRVSDEG